MSAPEMSNWLLTLIVLICFIVIFIIIVALNIPKMVAVKLKYVIQVIWGVIP
jgi:hypothetical protein